MMQPRDQIALKFRVYLLDLLTGRELTFTQIRGCVARDYKEQKYKRQEINQILVNMHSNGLVVRRKLKKDEREDRGRFAFAVTDRGIERKKYYKGQLAERGM